MKKIIICILALVFTLCGCTSAEIKDESSEYVNAVYVKSVWISYFELESFTSENDNEKDFESAIKAAFKKIKSFGLNTVTVQVRPCGDAFYKSSYFPVSKYCFGKEGSELKYDPLKIMTDVAHRLDLRIEAWINPYRVSQTNKIEELSDENPAKKWYSSSDKKRNVYVNDKIYYNPASADVTELIVNGVKEIVQNYAVDGIHFDDYFYPTNESDIDEEEYETYKNGGGEQTLDEWRRQNVSDMVKSVYSAIKEINSFVEFGISPQSNISTDYNKLYADVERWATEEGFLDYICPQIYFGFYNEVQPFTRTAKKWSELTSACKLYVGLPLYKSGQKDDYASSDQDYAINEFIENNNVISRQIIYLNQLDNMGGFYIFSYSYLTDENSESIKREIKEIMKVI